MIGALVIDKPSGVTSHDVVRRARRALNERSIGHLGTLDPMATGVLPLLLGKATRLAQFFLQSEKTYEGEIRFGFATDTFDKDGQPLGQPVSPQLDLESVRDQARQFTGEIMQRPPQFSAKKIAGTPAYKLARKKVSVELQPVLVTVRELEILSLAGDRASFRCKVSAGTYVRAIAHGLGQATGAGAHLTRLRRVQSGEFGLANAITMEELEDPEIGKGVSHIIHPRDLLRRYPNVLASASDEAAIAHGMPIHITTETEAEWVKIFGAGNQLLTIARRAEGTLFQPRVVFEPA